jgi:hypothetical protein
METELDYYQRPEISYSDLSMFKKTGFKAFIHHYNKRNVMFASEATDAMLLGSMVHCAILEPWDYERRYKLGSTFPDGMMGNLLKIIKTKYEEQLCLEDPLDIETICLEAYKVSEYKISFSSVWKKLNENNLLTDYLNEKTCASKNNYIYVKAEIKAKADKIRNEWLNIKDLEGFPYNLDEFEKEAEVFVYPEEFPGMGLKGKIDAFKYDPKTDTGHILDIKTMGDVNILNMKHLFEERGYIEQLSHYTNLLCYEFNTTPDRFKRTIMVVRTYYPYNFLIFDDIPYQPNVIDGFKSLYELMYKDTRQFKDVYSLYAI